MPRLTYDTVIVTRNRPEALRMSIPLLLSQSRKPNKVIIVDSSDQPAEIRSIVESFAANSDIPLHFLRSEPGITIQRNLGITQVTSDITFFPDDDSLVLPGALESIMRVYERDEEEIVGGVCSAEAVEAPKDILSAASHHYQMDRFDKVRKSIARLRYALENKFVPDPFSVHAQTEYLDRQTPNWLVEENAVVVEWMTGFRMSFRTHLVRQNGFDEILSQYSWAEDTEAGFHVMKTHFLIGARNAQIYHYRFPGPRGSGRIMGIIQVLNRAYIIAKHSEPGSLAMRNLRRFSWYKIAQYATRLDSQYGRERFAGAVAAYRCIPELLSAGPDELADTYKRLRSRCLGQVQN